MTTVALCEHCGDPAACAALFREKAARAGLEITLEGSLATRPGSIHLHLRSRGERTGVLEYTMDVRARRSWLSWHENRYRAWIDEAVAQLVG